MGLGMLLVLFLAFRALFSDLITQKRITDICMWVIVSIMGCIICMLALAFIGAWYMGRKEKRCPAKNKSNRR